MLYELTSPATTESENRQSHRVGLLGQVMFNGIIHLTCKLSTLYPIESQRSCNWTKMYNFHQNCILCDTYYTQVHFIQFQPAFSSYRSIYGSYVYLCMLHHFGHSKHIVHTHLTSCGMDGSQFPSITCVHLEFIGYMNTWLNNHTHVHYTTTAL